jgi:alpha-aminoadipate/glutamate carrier protein LysW
VIARLPGGFWHVTDPIAKPNARSNTPRRRMASCPECDAEIEVDEFDVDKGDQLSCPECGSNLEVTGVAPIELDLAPEDEDDDDDDDEVDEEEGDEDEDDEDDEEDDKDWEE